jgi:cytoskeletal protein CcmA (bactofilin family)
MSFFGNRRQTDLPPPVPTRTEPQRPPALPQPVGFETVLGANSTLEGTFKSNANVRLDGIFKGTLEITGNVLVGETAKIEADINARNISIAGAVRGNVTGRKVQLLRTGRIWGDIRAQALTTEEGAFIDGKITIVTAETAAPEVPASEAVPSESSAPEASASGAAPGETPGAAPVTSPTVSEAAAPDPAQGETPHARPPADVVP